MVVVKPATGLKEFNFERYQSSLIKCPAEAGCLNLSSTSARRKKATLGEEIYAVCLVTIIPVYLVEVFRVCRAVNLLETHLIRLVR